MFGSPRGPTSKRKSDEGGSISAQFGSIWIQCGCQFGIKHHLGSNCVERGVQLGIEVGTFLASKLVPIWSQCWPTWNRIWLQIRIYMGPFGIAFGSFCSRGQVGIVLGSTWGLLEINMGSTCGHIGINLGSICHHCGGRFGIKFGSIGVQPFRPIVGPSLSPSVGPWAQLRARVWPQVWVQAWS